MALQGDGICREGRVRCSHLPSINRAGEGRARSTGVFHYLITSCHADGVRSLAEKQLCEVLLPGVSQVGRMPTLQVT